MFESLSSDSIVSGIPARLHKNRLRQEVIINQLPDILNRIRKLEKELSLIKVPSNKSIVGDMLYQVESGIIANWAHDRVLAAILIQTYMPE